MDKETENSSLIASAVDNEEPDGSSWTFLERESSVDSSSESGQLLRIDEVENPSDFESDGSSIVVVEDSPVTQSCEEDQEESGVNLVPAVDDPPVEEDPQAVPMEELLPDEGNIEDEATVNAEEVEEVVEEVEAIKDIGDSDQGDEDDSDENPIEESSEDGVQFKPPPDLLQMANRIDEMDQLDYSALTQQDLPADLSLSSTHQTRHYIHQRNSQLNLWLNLIVAFTVATVLGFGLGHFIGLSDDFPPRPGCSFAAEETVRLKKPGRFEDWTEADWLAEVQRLSGENLQLRESLEAKDSVCSSHTQEDLVQENEDLRNTIGRMRYGRPTRSYEDLDRINRLETENQELRELVGKLRYSCKGSDGPFNPASWNVTEFWNKYVLEATDQLNASHAVKEHLQRLRQSTTEIIRVIEDRWIELKNISQQFRSPEMVSMVTQAFSESAENIIDLGAKFAADKSQKASQVMNDLAKKVGDVMLDLDKNWKNIREKFQPQQKTSPTEKHETRINQDWFLAMGRQREAARKLEKRSDWLFNRAQVRGQERQKKLDINKNRKSNMKHKKSIPKYRSSKY